ncbi:DUF397 domain-containing protein [Streptomyces sp. AJS327]|uniref:DUF397 domain-containing protein n=1 Tax=Streptomyces sp. AJS327 TaxID=2545265 RepID=UPI0015DFC286|nr:DUF397 domain-containing protein [Streptomyces sp. AJS327]MBA0050858.1 DUF397 domain-containing protein [Streptomyces sp. AJS327]
MRAYEPRILPGLLQTEEYMRVMFTALERPERVDQFVQIRMKRKELLANPRDFMLRTIIDTPALHRIEGDPELVRNQLNYLLEVGMQPNVSIQVMPLDASLSMLQYGPFNIMGLLSSRHAVRDTKARERGDLVFEAEQWAEFVDGVRDGLI